MDVRVFFETKQKTRFISLRAFDRLHAMGVLINLPTSRGKRWICVKE